MFITLGISEMQETVLVIRVLRQVRTANGQR